MLSFLCLIQSEATGQLNFFQRCLFCSQTVPVALQRYVTDEKELTRLISFSN